MSKLENTLRCRHRHNITEHPKCFSDGKPKTFSKGGGFPKILVLDIETATMLVRVYELARNNYIGHHKIEKDWFIISWAGKWLFNPDAFGDVVTPNEALERDDRRIVLSLWNVLNEADIVITHNGNGFDIPKINTRLLLHGFPPPTHYRSIDTIQTARTVFGFSSNALDYLNKVLGLGLKDNMVFSDWVLCEEGNKETLQKMFKYNKGDVINLEDLYLVLRPWIQNHPNIGVYMDADSPVCRNCGSDKHEITGTYKTNTGEFVSYRCECGANGRYKENILSKTRKKNLTA